MCYFDQVFSDVFAQKKNWLTKIDGRIKFIIGITVLLINLITIKTWIPLMIMILSLSMLASIRIPLRMIAVRIMVPFAVAVLVLITQVFWYGQTPLFVLSVFGLNLVGYEEGLAHGFLIFFRALGGIAVVIWLSFTTSFGELLTAARWFKIPAVLIEIASFFYRYLFVLMEEATRIREAQTLRLGYNSWRSALKTTSTILGMLLIRSYDRSQTVYEAMTLRGYKETK
jgi:cobalt/nickel transport system permease protein